MADFATPADPNVSGAPAPQPSDANYDPTQDPTTPVVSAGSNTPDAFPVAGIGGTQTADDPVDPTAAPDGGNEGENGESTVYTQGFPASGLTPVQGGGMSEAAPGTPVTPDPALGSGSGALTGDGSGTNTTTAAFPASGVGTSSEPVVSPGSNTPSFGGEGSPSSL